MVQRERVARRALFAVGRDDDDLTERRGSFLQALETVRQYAIIVGEEKPHQRRSPPYSRVDSN
jgi:hypothetical protein